MKNSDNLACILQVSILASKMQANVFFCYLRGEFFMSNSTSPAYFMIQMNSKNPEEVMTRYAQFVFPIIDQFKGQMIAGSDAPRVLEGKFVGNWVAILQFPSMKDAEAWYNSKEYKPYKSKGYTDCRP
jgi:uncharacterized protein (DUF1330 family)